MSKEVAKTESRDTNTGASVADLLRVAVETGLAPESMEKLVELQILMRSEDAKAAFAADYAQMQGELAPVVKNAEGHQGRYATLDRIETVVRPVLARHGFSYSYTTEKDDGERLAVCRLRHRLGYTEETRFPCAIDSAARMNDSQKVASAASYARRYALLLALGVSTTDTAYDDDAQSLTETVTEKEAADLRALCEDVGADMDRFLKWAGVASFLEITAKDKPRIVRALEAKRAKA